MTINVILQTARAGSKSVPNKNIAMVGNKPLFAHSLEKALSSKLVDHYFVSTDCNFIKQYVKKYKNVNIIDRPSHLSLDNSSHHDVMIHAIEHIEKQLGKKIDNLIILLGNSLGTDSTSIDACLKILKENKSYDAVQTVSKFNMFNPYRAFKIDSESGVLKNFVNVPENSNDKNFAGDIMFFNGSFLCVEEILLCKKTA